MQAFRRLCRLVISRQYPTVSFCQKLFKTDCFCRLQKDDRLKLDHTLARKNDAPMLSGSKRDWWKGHPNRKDVPTTSCSTTVLWNDICFGWSCAINREDVLSRRYNYCGHQPQPRAPSSGTLNHWSGSVCETAWYKLRSPESEEKISLKNRSESGLSMIFHIYGNGWSTLSCFTFSSHQLPKKKLKSLQAATQPPLASPPTPPRSSAGQTNGCPNHPTWIRCDILHQRVKEEDWKPKWNTSKTNPSKQN